MRRPYPTRALLNPRCTWREGDADERQARQLAQKFHAYVTPLSYNLDEAVCEAVPGTDAILLA